MSGFEKKTSIDELESNVVRNSEEVRLFRQIDKEDDTKKDKK